MKLYVKNYSSYKSDTQTLDIKKELKQKYKYDTRRQDEFIHMAVYGAQLLKEKTQIDVDDELYVTSGVGNIDVIQRTNTYVYEEKQAIKLFDFINLLGNTTSYYIASSLGIKGKNIFQISDNFTYLNTLTSLFSSISTSKKDAILCAIDLVNTPDEVIKRVLGINESTEVVSSVNYQKFSLDSKDAIAEIEFNMQSYTLDDIKDIVNETDTSISVSMRSKELNFHKESKFFETAASYAINKAIKNNHDSLYIDCFEDKYKILKVKNLK